MRRVSVSWLTPPGDVDDAVRFVPTLPAFDEAFAAFARGTLFAGARGVVAVEDLWPGTELRMADGRLARVVWRGSTVIVPRGDGQDPAMSRLTRIPAEALGLGRPYQDLVLGPHARLVMRRPGMRRLTGQEVAAIPAADFVDGVGIVEVSPPSPVEVFHLAFDRHERLLANGVEVESYHPGPLHALPLRGETMQPFLACFPHVTDLAGFGAPALPRLRLRDLDLIGVA
ncbi:hypothetical protein FHG71_00565 [Rubellimicrobium roseum]|uniref:Hedgehog/Intein (Hint) domain-containing protein n=2 Tax=Rubellimicrobium roseum TaxID=687525 RepID=A0A5C4NJN3_9RHOB|nr:hypothetical protein FHG71_00565 [Rubellimicrobium roseum]